MFIGPLSCDLVKYPALAHQNSFTIVTSVFLSQWKSLEVSLYFHVGRILLIFESKFCRLLSPSCLFEILPSNTSTSLATRRVHDRSFFSFEASLAGQQYLSGQLSSNTANYPACRITNPFTILILDFDLSLPLCYKNPEGHIVFKFYFKQYPVDFFESKSWHRQLQYWANRLVHDGSFLWLRGKPGRARIFVQPVVMQSVQLLRLYPLKIRSPPWDRVTWAYIFPSGQIIRLPLVGIQLWWIDGFGYCEAAMV